MENNPDKKDKLISARITFLVHVLLILLLVFVALEYEQPQEESGVLLMAGEVELSSGNESVAADEGVETGEAEVETPPTPAPVPSDPVPSPSDPEPIISQNIEDAPDLALEEQKQKEEDLEKKAEEEAKRKADEEARKKAEEEARKKAEEEAKRKAAQNLVAGAFGNNSGTGDQANGAQGNPNGNSDLGATVGNAGYGQYDLGGRGISGNLPRPSFDVNASGKVVVKITVDPKGNVIGAEIANGTTTANQTLRNAAISAARKARFAEVSGIGNQQGTITYLFDSNN